MECLLHTPANSIHQIDAVCSKHPAVTSGDADCHTMMRCHVMSCTPRPFNGILMKRRVRTLPSQSRSSARVVLPLLLNLRPASQHRSTILFSCNFSCSPCGFTYRLAFALSPLVVSTIPSLDPAPFALFGNNRPSQLGRRFLSRQHPRRPSQIWPLKLALSPNLPNWQG